MVLELRVQDTESGFQVLGEPRASCAGRAQSFKYTGKHAVDWATSPALVCRVFLLFRSLLRQPVEARLNSLCCPSCPRTHDLPDFAS